MQNQQEQLGEKTKRFSVRILIVIAIFAVLLFAFAKITNEIIFEKETGFDERVFSELFSLRSKGLTNIMEFFTFFGGRKFLFPTYCVIVAYYLFFKNSSAKSLGIAAVGLSGAGILFLLKNIFKRNRPLEPLVDKITSFSYPSGHSFSAFTFFGMLIYLMWDTKVSRTIKWIASITMIAFACMIAISRVYLHVHYASDVIAGFCLSILWLYTCYHVFKTVNIVERSSGTTKNRRIFFAQTKHCSTRVRRK